MATGYRWLLGTFVTVLLAGGTMWMGHVDGELSRVEDWQVQNTDRISRVESKVDVSLQWLERIERKLDRLMEREDGR